MGVGGSLQVMKPFLLPLALSGLLAWAAPAAADDEKAAAPVAPAVDAPVFQSDDLAGMEGRLGSDIVVEGVVQTVAAGPSDGITFLNFGKQRGDFVAVVFRPSYEKFPEGFDKYARQKVRVHGRLEKFRDRQLQIRISTPDQIKILESAPAPTPARE